MPTSTANTLRTTHPILASQSLYQHRYYLIHNGMIQNAKELKAKHEKLGLNYATLQQCQEESMWRDFGNTEEFNDSEALAHEVALFLEDRQQQIEAEGDIAFICLETDRNHHALKLHFARNHGSPLEMKRDSRYLIIASRHVSHQDIPTHQLQTFDYHTRKISVREMELPEAEVFSRFLWGPLDDWYQQEVLERKIQEYEARLERLESAQWKASFEGDLRRYERLGQMKQEITARIESLVKEWYELERF